MKISHVLASHAKFYTISSFCRCCCENLGEHIVDFHDLFEEGVFLPEENNNPFGVSPFFRRRVAFSIGRVKKKTFY